MTQVLVVVDDEDVGAPQTAGFEEQLLGGTDGGQAGPAAAVAAPQLEVGGARAGRALLRGTGIDEIDECLVARAIEPAGPVGGGAPAARLARGSSAAELAACTADDLEPGGLAGGVSTQLDAGADLHRGLMAVGANVHGAHAGDRRSPAGSVLGLQPSL